MLDENKPEMGFNPWPCSVGQGSGIAMSCGVGCKCHLDPALLWLWCRLAAVAPIHLLAWELPYAAGAALKRKKMWDNSIHFLGFSEDCLPKCF